MKKAAIAILIASTLGLGACQPEAADPLKVETIELTTEDQKEAYAVGASVGSFVFQKLQKEQELGMEMDHEMLIKGFIAALQDKAQLESDEIMDLARGREAKVNEAMAAQAAKMGEQNKADGEAFLAENAKREGVTVTDSGLQYEVITAAEGAQPKATDTVTVHYKGTLIDDTEFDSSYSRGEPTSFPLNRVIRGWTEGLQLMNVGSKFKFYIPSDLAYGSRNMGTIKPNSTLVFEVELLSIGAEQPVE